MDHTSEIVLIVDRLIRVQIFVFLRFIVNDQELGKYKVEIRIRPELNRTCI